MMDRDALKELTRIHNEFQPHHETFCIKLQETFVEGDAISWHHGGKLYHGTVRCISGTELYASSKSLSRPMWITVDEVLAAAAYINAHVHPIVTQDGTRLINGRSV